MVPKGYGFCEEYPADKIYVDSKEIFQLFNFYRLDVCVIRLCALYQAKDARILKVKDLAIADPYLMNQNNLGNEAGR